MTNFDDKQPEWLVAYKGDVDRRLRELEKVVEKNTLAMLSQRSAQQRDRDMLQDMSNTTKRVVELMDNMQVMDRFVTGFVDRAQKLAVFGAVLVGVFVGVNYMFDWIAKQLARLHL